MGMPDALITTPAENTQCAQCDRPGVRYEDLPVSFAHCPSCGTTDLLDTRSPFEVLAEARRNAADPTVDAETRIYRQDIADRVRHVADEVTDEHLARCGDCARWARVAGRPISPPDTATDASMTP